MARPQLIISYRFARTGVRYHKPCTRCADLIGPFPTPERAYSYASECFPCRHLPRQSTKPTRR
jgi:hypothetical protein